MSTTYTATVAREDDWWIIAVPAINAVTQARRLVDVEATARELIAVTRDVDESDIDVDVHRE